MRAWVREWACTPFQSPLNGPGWSIGPPDLRGRSLRATAPAGRLECRKVCKPPFLRRSRKRVYCPVTKESARALGGRGFGEGRGPGFSQPSSQFVAARPRARMAPGRPCIPNVCRARWRPRCQKHVDDPAAPCARELAHHVRDVCAGAAQKSPEALGRAEVVTQRVQQSNCPCEGR